MRCEKNKRVKNNSKVSSLKTARKVMPSTEMAKIQGGADLEVEEINVQLL